MLLSDSHLRKFLRIYRGTKLFTIDISGKSGKSKKATRSVPVERIKHSDAIALTRPLLLGKPSKTIPPLRLISLLLLSFFFHFLISIDDVKYG